MVAMIFRVHPDDFALPPSGLFIDRFRPSPRDSFRAPVRTGGVNTSQHNNGLLTFKVGRPAKHQFTLPADVNAHGPLIISLLPLQPRWSNGSAHVFVLIDQPGRLDSAFAPALSTPRL